MTPHYIASYIGQLRISLIHDKFGFSSDQGQEERLANYAARGEDIPW